MGTNTILRRTLSGREQDRYVANLYQGSGRNFPSSSGPCQAEFCPYSQVAHRRDPPWTNERRHLALLSRQTITTVSTGATTWYQWDFIDDDSNIMASASYDGNHMAVFIVGADKALYTKYWSNTAGWLVENIRKLLPEFIISYLAHDWSPALEPLQRLLHTYPRYFLSFANKGKY